MPAKTTSLDPRRTKADPLKKETRPEYPGIYHRSRSFYYKLWNPDTKRQEDIRIPGSEHPAPLGSKLMSWKEAHAVWKAATGTGAVHLLRSDVLFLDYATDVLDNRLECAASSRAQYHRNIRKWPAKLHRMKVAEVTTLDIRTKLLAPMKDAGLADTTRSVILASVSQILDFAVGDKLLLSNPAAGLSKHERPKGTVRVEHHMLTERELDLVLTKAKDAYRPFIATLAFTGARFSEVMGLRWRDIDFDKATVRIHKQQRSTGELTALKGKAARDYRVVDMPGLLAPHLRRQQQSCGINRRDDDLVFPGINRGTMQHYITRLGRRLGLTDKADRHYRFSAHSLRHNYVTVALAMGIDAQTISDSTGHTIDTMHRNYAHKARIARTRGAMGAAMDAAFG